MKKNLVTIGNIKTPYSSIDECPNNVNPNGPICELALEEAYKDGLEGLKLNQKIQIMYWLDNANRNELIQSTDHQSTTAQTGVFNLRSPHRPNPIGIAELKILGLKDGKIQVRGLDCLNGTALLDIKPHIL